MNQDLISRRAARDALNQLSRDNFSLGDWFQTYLNALIAADDAIQSLPSVQPQSKREWYQKGYEAGQKSVQPQRWIPVTERLPEDDEEVIVTCLDDSGDTPFRYTTVAWHYKGMWVCDNERCPFVTAWMPLPEPYTSGADMRGTE